MNQYLYRLTLKRPGLLTEGPTEAEATTLKAHVQHLNELTNRNVVLLAGRTQTETPDTFGIVILQADTEQAARAHMQDDPAVAQGVMDAQLYPFRIAVQAQHRSAEH